MVEMLEATAQIVEVPVVNQKAKMCDIFFWNNAFLGGKNSS